MKKIIDPFLSLLKNHYNNTGSYPLYNVNTNQFELFSYTEPIKNIILSDVVTVGVLYYILFNL